MPIERLVVVPDVGPVGGVGALGDPPQPEQADDVVDADGARVPQHRAEHVPVGPVGRARQGVGTPRRLRPVLPLLVVHVRRRADPRATGEHVTERPDVGALRVHPDGQVVHDPERHAPVERGTLRGGELLVGHPLQPLVELDALRELLAAARVHARRRRVAGRRRATSCRRTSRPARTTARTSRARCPPPRRTRRTPPAVRPSVVPRRPPRAPHAWPSRPRPGRSGRRRRRWRAPVRPPTRPACGPPTDR